MKRPWTWDRPDAGETWIAHSTPPTKPAAPQLTETDPVEKARLYGPDGELLAVAYDRAMVPFGFTQGTPTA